jgi:hypothetical protein
MSAGTSANSGAERYRSPVSGSIARMFAPFGASRDGERAGERGAGGDADENAFLRRQFLARPQH